MVLKLKLSPHLITCLSGNQWLALGNTAISPGPYCMMVSENFEQ